MNHADHLALIEKGVSQMGGGWAEFGAGSGAFTRALAELIGPNGWIYAVDQDRSALKRAKHMIHERFGARSPEMHYLAADYTRPLDLPVLDGVLIANALHFQREKATVLRLIRGYLRPGGSLLLVEYNTDRGNHWVPYPLSFPSWERLAESCGFVSTRLLATRPSSFLGEFYAAESKI